MSEPDGGARAGRAAALSGLVVTALLAAGFVVAFVGAVEGTIAPAVLGALAVWVLDVGLYVVGDRRIVGALNTASAGISWRAFVRQILLVVALVVAGHQSSDQFRVLLGLVLVHHLVLGLFLGLRTVTRVRRLRRLETRNLDVPGAELPPALPELLLQRGSQLLLNVDLLLILAAGWGWLGGSYDLVIPAAIATVVLALVVPLAFVPQVIALYRLPSDEVRLQAAQRAVLDAAPVVVLYFSGGAADVYQVNMWLETMARLERPVLVLLRERRYLDDLAATSVPVLCLPFTADVMNLDLPGARVALYVANVGRNIHLLREPGLKSAFIGHGDSDKDASRNPFSRAYNQIWVAGPAGRERYRVAGIGVSDQAFREIGRPALGSLARRPDTEPMLTVLYAPTWEGWGETPNHSSLAVAGVALVRELLTRPGVRVMYRPHPRTGHILPEMRQAHREVVALLEQAGASAPVAVVAPRPSEVGDALDACLREQPVADGVAVREAQDEQFWREHPGHRILTATGPDLYASFRMADALISDVSSVVTDFLAADRPYAIVNNTEVDEHDFRNNVPAATGGHVIGRDLSGLDSLLAAAADPRQDGTSGPRARARHHLLGSSGAEAQLRFKTELDRLAGLSGPADLDVVVSAVVGK